MPVSRRLELVRIEGDPTPAERRAVEVALERLVQSEREATAPSLWLRASRGRARGLGMLDYRDRFSSDDAWRLSARFPSGGREYPGLAGRADAR